jgi:hypothetical protein
MACFGMLAFSAAAFTTASVPSDGVYKFTFGVGETQDGSIPVSANAVCDVKDETLESGKFSYGFLGTTDTSYIDDIPWSLGEPRAIDGFSVVSGQKIVLRNAADANGVSCVDGPAKSEYLPAGACDYEGRYPIRFAMRGEEYAYYAVTCTVANASSTANADVTLFSERTHIIAHHLSLAPGETKTFAWSVELAPNVYKTQGTYRDDCVNVCVVGENAALASLAVAKQPQTAGTVRGEAVDNMNVGRTMWLCTDSTGTDQAIATPFFSLQNYAGVGSGLSRWAPANLSIRNQGEGGLATSANAHRQSCRLKPGDYLYVEYGHNEGGVTSFTNNLETYLSDANAAGAYLVIVSPVERRIGWDSATSTWGRSLQGIAEAGEAWVEEKIAHGARNVAFIDLNKKYSDWMNDELRRINGVNGDVSLNAAISFYYRSAKGANVDNTHINTAGADWAAYCVWQDALERVAAGANAEEGSAAKVQADVLKGITDGCQLKVGVGGTVDNTPWLVADEIINAGPAPNSFWDTPVSEGYAYVNDAAVANVEATANEDGTVTITGVTMRILNPNNYYKSVIEVFSASGLSQGVYYSYYNYDIGGAGKVSGDLVNPNQPGFLTSDRGKDDVSAADVESVTVPAGGKALVWIAEADAGTWQVGENAPCSAKYPVEWWSDVIFDNDCSSLDGWAVNSQAVNEYSLSEKGGIYFMSAGADAGNTKKNYGFYHQFDNAAQMTNGRYRVSFKVMMDSGHITWQLFNSLGNTTTPFNGTGTTFLDVLGTTLTSYAGTAPLFTLGDEDAPQNIVNKLRWIDVDAIIDRDNDRAWVSAGGSDYVEYQNAAFLPGGYAGTTWQYFGISCESQMSSYGYVDDVKIVKLAGVEYPTVTAKATCNADMGSVTINGSATDSLTVYSGNDLLFKATSADPDMYAFEGWTDAEGNVVSTSPTYYVADATESISLSASFREYGHDENRVATWDFSGYRGNFAVVPASATIVNDNGMTFSLQSGDSMTAEGKLYWHNSALGHKSWSTAESLSETDDNYIIYTPSASGTFTLKFSVDNYNANRKPTMFIKAAGSFGECTKTPEAPYASVVVDAANKEYTLSAELDAGVTYYIWTYSNNWAGGGYTHNYTISSITYTYAPVRYTATAAVNNANYGSAVVDGAAAAEVFSGREVTFVATPASSAYRFVNWTDGEENIVSTEATFTVPVSADVAYTANFEKAAAGDAVELSYDFAPFAGNNAVTESGSQKVTAYGPFEIYTSDSNRGNDSITENGIYWHVPSNDIYSRNYNADQPCDYVHYIKFTAPADGAVRIVFKTDTVVSKRELSLCVSTGELSDATWNKKITNVQPASANTDYTLAQEVTAGITYWFWCASQNWDAGNAPTATTISSISYSRASDPTTLTVANSDSTAGAVTVNGAAITEAIDVQKGEYMHLVATPNAGGLFGGWKNESDEVVSAEADFWLCVEEATSLVATWRTVDTHSFTWNWNVSEGDWNDPANWFYEGGVPATTCPNDAESDYVTFNTAAKVNLGEGASAKEVWLNGAVTFTNGTLTASLVMRYEDDGRAILANAGFANPKNLAAEISCPIVMTAGTINWFNKVSDGDWKDWMTVSGDISGEGRYNVNLANVQGNGVKFTGNNNGFHGDVYTYGGKSNRSVINWSTNAVGTNSFLHVGHSYGTYNGDSYRMGADVKFGGVDGGWWDRYDGALLTIGYLNRDSVINISNGVGGRANSVAKVGNANLTLGTKTIKDLTISAGSVTMPVGIALHTLTIADGTRIIVPGDAAWTDGTVTNLFSYATLAGAGTLAEQVEVTGLAEGLVAKITVADNTVTATIEAAAVAPTTDDENATITKNGDGSYTVEVTAETVAITVPDGVTLSEVVVSPNTATVTGVPANAVVKVVVSWTDAQDITQSAAYAIVKVDSKTGAVTLDEDAVVTVGEEEIALKPELSEAGEEVSPLDVGETVFVGVKSIPGLVYRLARGTAVDGIDTNAANAVAEQEATSSRVSLVDDDPPAKGAFYKVTVELK